MAAFIAPAISAIGSIFGGLFGSSGARKAGQIEADAAQRAQQLEAQNQNQALDFTKGVYGTERSNLSPFLNAGQGAVMRLSDLINPNAPGSVTAPWTSTFKPPSIADLNDPNNPQFAGFQFQKQQGDQAINNSASAMGSLFNPETSEALSNYNQGLANTYSQGQYNNAFENYLQNYRQFQNNQSNTYNRLLGLTDVGTTATGQEGSIGTSLSGQVGNILLTGGQQQAQQIDAAAQARAGGILGSTNAFTQAFGNTANSFANQIQLGDLLKLNNSSSYGPGSPQTGAYTSPSTWGPYNPNYQG